jgi:pilus biogenesis lipoprotein CpaD
MQGYPARSGLAAVLGIIALSLSGCSSTAPEGFVAADFQAAPRQILKVETRRESHTLYIDRKSGQPSPLERQRLDAFIADLAGNRPEAVHVELRGAASAQQLQRVANLLLAAGVDPSNIKLLPGQSADAAGPRGTEAVTIAAERGVAVVPDCPGWFDHVSAPSDNKVNPNFGCSDTSNFAAMIADPKDLAKGRSTPFSDGERAANAVSDYRAGKVKDLPKEPSQFQILPSAR